MKKGISLALLLAGVASAAFAAPDCQSFSIVDTNVSKAKANNKWQEVWTIRACQRTANVPINFEIKEDGATYAIDPMGVRVINK